MSRVPSSQQVLTKRQLLIILGSLLVGLLGFTEWGISGEHEVFAGKVLCDRYQVVEAHWANRTPLPEVYHNCKPVH